MDTKDRLTRDTARDATRGEATKLKWGNARLKQLVAELSLQVYVIKKWLYRNWNKGEVYSCECYREERHSYLILRREGLIKPDEIVGFKAGKEYHRKTKLFNLL